MSVSKDQLSIEAARMYYQLDYGQQKIAAELDISRPTVSRLLKHAKERGFITIEIHDPFNEGDRLANRIKEKYGLEEVIVVQSQSENYELVVEQISSATADFLERSVIDGDIIGVGWGTTVYKVAQKLHANHLKKIQVVQLKGNITHSRVNTYAHETLSLFAENYHTVGTALPLPVIFDNKAVKDVVEKDRHIQNILDLQKQATVAIYTVGTSRAESLLLQLGYLNEEQKAFLQQHAVGDICSRFYDQGGQIIAPEINERTVGIALEELPKKRLSVLVAGGCHKLLAVKGALKGNYPNVLITDYQMAQQLLH